MRSRAMVWLGDSSPRIILKTRKIGLTIVTQILDLGGKPRTLSTLRSIVEIAALH